jgi:hypothetical protein
LSNFNPNPLPVVSALVAARRSPPA